MLAHLLLPQGDTSQRRLRSRTGGKKRPPSSNDPSTRLMLNAVGVPLLRHAPVEDAEMMLDWNAYRERRFADLSEQEILALAVSNEEEDHRHLSQARRGLAGELPRLHRRCCLLRCMSPELAPFEPS